MCGSEELIHDARQVDLEDVIMTNETPMYLVPGRLTDEQASKATEAATRALARGRETCIADYIIHAIGTPIQPCADVRTIAWEVWTDGCDRLFYGEDSARECAANLGGIVNPLVRRTDMEAQVARVAAEKDAEIARLQAKQPLYDRVVHENGELKLAVARLQAQDDKDITQVIEERDEREQVISDLYHAAMGEYPEWSNNFGYRDAVEDVVDYVHALRTKALNEGAAG